MGGGGRGGGDGRRWGRRWGRRGGWEEVGEEGGRGGRRWGRRVVSLYPCNPVRSSSLYLCSMVDCVILGSVMAARLCCSLRAEGGEGEGKRGEGREGMEGRIIIK